MNAHQMERYLTSRKRDTLRALSGLKTKEEIFDLISGVFESMLLDIVELW